MLNWEKRVLKYIKHPFVLICAGIIFVVLLMLVFKGGFTITFDTEGGSEVAEQKQRYGSLVEEPGVPEKPGYDFVCWYQQDKDGIPWVFETDIVKKDITLVAFWTQAQLIVDFDLNGGKTKDGGEELAPIQVTYGEHYGEMPEPVKGSAVFVGWEYQGQLITPETQVLLSDDHVLTAVWEDK